MRTLSLKLFLVASLALPAAAQTSLRLEVVDGKTKQPLLSVEPNQTKSAAGGLILNREYLPAAGSHPETYTFAIQNNSDGERWLYLNWETTWSSPSKAAPVKYWPGKGDPITGELLQQHPHVDESLNTSMLQAIYDGTSGLALALPPHEIISQFQQSLQYNAATGAYRLQLQLPIALEPGEKDSFPLELFQFKPRYGFLDALEKYYAAHPADFHPRTNIDPRAGGFQGGRPWRDILEGRPVMAYETRRRFGGDWDWVYAPFRRTGDIYGRDDLWDYTPPRPFGASRQLPSAKAFREKRQKDFETADALGMAVAFYVPSFLYVEDQLALQRYPGAIIRKTDGSYQRHYTTPWVTGQDNELLVYPWGNSFAQQSMTDARQLVAENNIPAFGYDIMAGSALFRGEGMQQSPRRSFDSSGEYVDSGVGIAKMADFTRFLVNKGRQVGLVGNATSETRPYLVARSDTLMFEQPAYYYAEELVALRYAAGQKAINFLVPWRLADLVKWQDMTPAELKEAYQAAADYTRLISYRYGGYPGALWANGAPSIARSLPLMKEVISQCWQAVPAIRPVSGQLPETIWPARYGQGLGSYLTIGNADKTPWTGELLIDDDYLGEANYLFVSTDGIALPQTVTGRTTRLKVTIPARETLVLRAIANVPIKSAGTTTVSWKDDGAKGMLSIQGGLKPTKTLPLRSGWTSIGNANFVSPSFDSPTQDIREFPFFGKGINAQIVLPENPTPDQEWSAQRLHDYFQFWGKESAQPSQEVDLPILRGLSKSNPDLPRIIIGSPGKIRRQNQDLFLSGSDVRAAPLQLLAELDKKFPYSGKMPTTGREAEALKKAGLAGGSLAD